MRKRRGTKHKGWTHEQCAKRRAAVAADLLAGFSREEAATRNGLSPAYVAQISVGVGVNQPRRRTSCCFAVIAGLLRGEQRIDIATRLGVSRQYVQQVLAQAEAVGITFPATAKETA